MVLCFFAFNRCYNKPILTNFFESDFMLLKWRALNELLSNVNILVGVNQAVSQTDIEYIF